MVLLELVFIINLYRNFVPCLAVYRLSYSCIRALTQVSAHLIIAQIGETQTRCKEQLRDLAGLPRAVKRQHVLVQLLIELRPAQMLPLINIQVQFRLRFAIVYLSLQRR